CPTPVLEATGEHPGVEGEIGGYEAADARQERVDGFYAATAELIGCEPHNVAFAPSATDAFARALSSIPFAIGDLILTTLDDYISNQIAFLSLRKRFGVEVVHAPNRPEGGVDIEAMAKVMDERRPTLVAATHVPTNSGLVQPVAAIGRHCRERDLLYLVDACPSVRPLPHRGRGARLRLPVRDVPEVPPRAARERLPLRLGSRARGRLRAALHRHARRALGRLRALRAHRDSRAVRGLGVLVRKRARS